ncbi:MAG: hypothetical protein M1573_01155 [Candidatus Parvarchaeota archaeon]|nr:hypothetical protein [Candidatus Parvarchaeota archaeon]
MSNERLETIINNFENQLSKEDYVDLSETADNCILLNERLPYPFESIQLLKITSYGATGIYGKLCLNPLFDSGNFLRNNENRIMSKLKAGLEKITTGYEFKPEFYEIRGTNLIKFIKIKKDEKLYGSIKITNSINIDLGVFSGIARKFVLGDSRLASQLEQDVNLEVKALALSVYISLGLLKNITEDVLPIKYRLKPDYESIKKYNVIVKL